MSETVLHPNTANPPEKRAGVLRALLERGGSVRRTTWGQIERRERSGRAAGKYAADVLAVGLEAGWLVEARRVPADRLPGPHDHVEYQLAAAASAPAAVATPTTETPKRVKRTVRRKAVPAPKPKAVAKPKANRKPVPKAGRQPDVPAVPPPLPDGTACLGLPEFAARYGVTVSAVSQALRRRNVDAGRRFRTPGRRGQAERSVALTPKTLAYAEATWADHGPPTVALPPAGAEVLQGDLARAMGYAVRPPARRLRQLAAAAPWRYVNPANHRVGKLYRVGPQLVAVLEGMGYAVAVETPAL